jgi:cathepsin D
MLTGDVSGILGLAFQELAGTKAVPFWQALFNSDQLTSPEFSLYLGRAPSQNTEGDVDGGVFTLGGTNETLFTGDVEFLDMPLLGRNWALPLTGKFSCPLPVGI